MYARRVGMVAFTFALASVACRGNAQPVDSQGEGVELAAAAPEASSSSPKASGLPKKNFELPASEDELRALLEAAPPPKANAIKGQLRALASSANLDLTRAAVVGASLSAGFGGLALSTALDRAISGEHELFAFASTFFFKDPHGNGKVQLDHCLRDKATTIFALDILFWYAYTPGSLERRMTRLEAGLRNLERIDVALILGDLPDMRTGQPWILSPAAIPSPDQLRELNDRIHSWARSRQNVTIAPLAKWSEALASGGTIQMDAHSPAVPAASLMNADGLHPNVQGVRYMLLRLDPLLEVAYPKTPEDALTF